MEDKQLNPTIISIIVLIIIGLAAGAVYVTTKDTEQAEVASSTQQEAETQSGESTTTQDSTTTDETGSYNDGTYTATGSYSTPGGTERITVEATLDDGVVTEVSATGSADSGESAEHQVEFISAFESLVVGKSIDDVSLSRVAGSSLTSNGFNRALETIKDEARG